MNKAVDVLALLCGILAFGAVIAIRAGEISKATAPDIVIKSTLAFMAVSVLSKIVFGKILRRIGLQRRNEMIEKVRQMQKQQASAQKK
jgi:hypothetical protein